MADNPRPTTSTPEEAKEAGYWGTPVDPTPREEYTVQGQFKRNKVKPGEPAGTDATVEGRPAPDTETDKRRR